MTLTPRAPSGCLGIDSLSFAGQRRATAPLLLLSLSFSSVISGRPDSRLRLLQPPTLWRCEEQVHTTTAQQDYVALANQRSDDGITAGQKVDAFSPVRTLLDPKKPTHSKPKNSPKLNDPARQRRRDYSCPRGSDRRVRLSEVRMVKKIHGIRTDLEPCLLTSYRDGKTFR